MFFAIDTSSQRRALPRIAILAAVLSLGTAPAMAFPAAPVSCQAIDATGLLNPMLGMPGPACQTPVGVGNTFEIDFSNVFAANPQDFSTTNSYSLQIANINTNTPATQKSFYNVQFLVSGSQGGTSFNDQPISVWQSSGQTGQGISNYATNGPGVDFGFGTAFKSANFTLTAPQAPGQFGTAGVINTIAFNPLNFGVTAFTGAKIRGTLSGFTGTSSDPSFSAGLAIFSINNPANEPPNLIYGNAFTHEVPGPLPILGAGAAFGFSRRLRRRLKAASVVS